MREYSALSKNDVKHVIAVAGMRVLVKDLLGTWNPDDHEGVTAEQARTQIAEWLDYWPIPVRGWDVKALGRKAGAGGRSVVEPE